MQISAAGSGVDALGQAQAIMMRKAMDMALQANEQLLSAMPAPPTGGSGGSVDVYA